MTVGQAGWLLRDVELADRLLAAPMPVTPDGPGPRVDVILRRGRVAAVARAGTTRPGPGDELVEGRGAALLPGLHDHHLHLNAMAATRRSVAVGPDDVDSADGFGAALRSAVALGRTDRGWVRAVGYHESVAGDLDRHRLDHWLPHVPVRVQHRGGALWVLNSVALDRVAGALDNSPDVERDRSGHPTGRLWRYDRRLAGALPDSAAAQRAALEEVARDLLRLGLTGATDATPELTRDAVELLTATAPLRLHLLGVDDSVALPGGWSRGPRKVLLRDHDLPTYDELVRLLDPREARAARRPVAVHCVTREALVLTAAVLAALGPVPGDRIEHGAVVPRDAEALVASLGCPVITQPDFLRTRGEDYLRDVDPDDVDHLYRWAGLTRAGVDVVGSSDAPYGEVDPWQVLRSARDRRTGAERVIGPEERVSTAVALRGYLTSPQAPAGPVRAIRPCAPADLVLLDSPLAEVLAAPAASAVACTWVAGDAVT